MLRLMFMLNNIWERKFALEAFCVFYSFAFVASRLFLPFRFRGHKKKEEEENQHNNEKNKKNNKIYQISDKENADANKGAHDLHCLEFFPCREGAASSQQAALTCGALQRSQAVET